VGVSTLSTRSIAKIFFVFAAFFAAVYFVYLIRDILEVLAISVFLAIAIAPPVEWLNSKGIPRSASILLVYLAGALFIFLIGLLIIPPIVDQVDGLSRDLPKYIEDVRNSPTFQEYDKKYDITVKLTEQAQKLPDRLGSAAGDLRTVTVGVFGLGVKAIAVLTITFFLLLDGHRLMDFAFGAMGPARAARYRPIAHRIYRAVAGYVAGNLLISIIAGFLTWLTLTILGVPFAVPLAVLVAFLDLIPLVGATIGGIAVAIVCAFTEFPTAPIVWIVVLIVYQQLENHILQPIIYRSTVNVPPIVVIISILIGASLLGVLGALLAIPVAATVQILLRDWWERRQQMEAERAELGEAVLLDGPAEEPPPAPAG
jgi:predicted PurR-regulated permease PerM